MPQDENEAWERMRAAVLRCQADQTEKNLAEVRRRSRELVAAMEGGDGVDKEAA